MSDNRLYFTFKNDVSFAMDGQHFDKGKRIHFDFDHSQVESMYQGSLMYLVSQEEVTGKEPLIKFKFREQYDLQFSEEEPDDYKQEPDTEKLKSVIMTSVREIVETSATAANKTTTRLTRTQKRNRNKRLKRQEERQLRSKKLKQSEDYQLDSSTFKPLLAETYPDQEMLDFEFNEEKRIEKTPLVPASYKSSSELVVLKEEVGKEEISKREIRRIRAVKWRTFEQFKYINGQRINILAGIKLFTSTFDEDEQAAIIDHVMDARDLGRAGRLRRRTYSEPNKWIRGKGRITIQYGCCYNYAKDNEGNPPGILQHEQVDPLPTVIIQIIKRLVTWGIMPASCVPDSCIINIYAEGDCIPPHIDSHDFERPFCTVSLMNRCSILFGREIRILGPGEFAGTYRIPLTRGSVLLFQGNGADVVKHCIPSVDRSRISITLRRMRPDKRPHGYRVIPELEGLKSFKSTSAL